MSFARLKSRAALCLDRQGGKKTRSNGEQQSAGYSAFRARPLCTTRLTDAYTPTPTQRATYKFFAVAAVLFLLQVTAGLMTIHGFVNYTGIDLAPFRAHQVSPSIGNVETFFNAPKLWL